MRSVKSFVCQEAQVCASQNAANAWLKLFAIDRATKMWFSLTIVYELIGMIKMMELFDVLINFP